MGESDPLAALTDDDCWTLLAENDLGRLVLSAAGDIDVFPVNFVADHGVLYVRTAPGTKLLELTVHPDVIFEVDHVDDDRAYSIVVRGIATELQKQSEIDEAEALPLRPILPTLKYRWVRITPTSLSGRLFSRGVEPDRF
ncbi:Pyridoxamine 5'-phosphate oxidase [Agreia bicolorata]|uniref:Pyridoxamine 5'-phosphate oxidase n=1 Tax=Agreia bicolorata TaxID=110935 RepID=A0A1T4YED3_9MICO|nr:pyridoxamine 5'-phosphate oxidase family protein [Agreia bicolorata]KJC65717.1 hypothetical protein TZ00_02735 [Agreia bicolorata]SKA99671.1 Pyridoxamine 5'-phosphate oxidase [Agreia bicolorata]